MICEICLRQFKKSVNLGSHISQSHKITTRQYYDMFLRKGDDGICKNPNCSNQTNFKNLNSGYFCHCSLSCATSDPNVQEKYRRTMFYKFEVDHPSKSKEINERRDETNLRKYGVKNPFQSEGCKTKTKETFTKKYGSSNIQKVDCIREKYRINSLQRHGVDSPNKLERVKKLKEETTMKNYGVTHVSKLEEKREKMRNGQAAYMSSFIRNPSKPQIILFRMCLQLLPSPILNYPVYKENKKRKCYSLDIADHRLGINIEYDGKMYHKDDEHDIERQNDLESNEGWKFLRYRIIIPSLEQLKDDVNTVLSNGSFTVFRGEL